MDEPLGLSPGTVRVVAYDPRWPQLYQAESARLRAALGPLEVHFEHMGSTAVPELAAKPVLDILAGYDSGTSPGLVVAGLVAAGYQHRSPQGIPDHEFFRRGQPRAYHIHLTPRGSDYWRDHLAFRDRLRTDAAVRDAYAALKHGLAMRHPQDREAYIAGKTAFVRRVVASARGAQRRATDA